MALTVWSTTHKLFNLKAIIKKKKKKAIITPALPYRLFYDVLADNSGVSNNDHFKTCMTEH